MPNDSHELDITKASTELIVYQIMEVKNLVRTLTEKVEKNQEKTEQRLSALEIWKAGEEEKGKDRNGGFDVQKIILAAFGIASSAIALGYGIVQSGLIGK